MPSLSFMQVQIWCHTLPLSLKPVTQRLAEAIRLLCDSANRVGVALLRPGGARSAVRCNRKTPLYLREEYDARGAGQSDSHLGRLKSDL